MAVGPQQTEGPVPVAGFCILKNVPSQISEAVSFAGSHETCADIPCCEETREICTTPLIKATATS